MDPFPTDIFHLLLFTVPGFFLVWSYRRQMKSSAIMSDFEYLMFSVFWGIVLIALIAATSSEEFIRDTLTNVYSACGFFSTMGMMFGTATAWGINKFKRKYFL